MCREEILNPKGMTSRILHIWKRSFTRRPVGFWREACAYDLCHGNRSEHARALAYRKPVNNISWAKYWALSSLVVSLLSPIILADAPAESRDVGELPDDEDEHVMVNWSGTHEVKVKRYFEPESVAELEALVLKSNEDGLRLRPVGSGLSPNGLGFEEEGMVNLGLLDHVLQVDKEKQQVTVQAGARVSQIVELLRPHGLTLQNYASIAEQQIGGLIQVGAHGTGAAIPPIDETVVGLKMMTPGAGAIQLTDGEEDKSLLQLAKVALGALGIVYEVTLQCIPMHKLVEETFVVSRSEVRKNHRAYMEQNKHLRYMWIPHTDKVVVVTCNPLKNDTTANDYVCNSEYSEAEKLDPARNLLRGSGSRLSEEEINSLSFTTLRDELLLLNPLSIDHVKAVNEVEAEYWSRSRGVRVDYSDKILGFDCGGQQWVSEIAFPVYDNAKAHMDLDFVEDVLDLIEKRRIPAPAPIEQRWSAPSSSALSPANEKQGAIPPVYSWVGIIMYLPDAAVLGKGTSNMRSDITHSFRSYKYACERELWPKYKAVEHWAKIEMPQSKEERSMLSNRMINKYPLQEFQQLRKLFDPKGILSNQLLDVILCSKPTSSSSET